MGTAPSIFPPTEYRLNRFNVVPVCSSWSGSSPMIFCAVALEIFARKDGRKISTKGTITATTADLVLADTSMHKKEINRQPTYQPAAISRYFCHMAMW